MSPSGLRGQSTACRSSSSSSNSSKANSGKLTPSKVNPKFPDPPHVPGKARRNSTPEARKGSAVVLLSRVMTDDSSAGLVEYTDMHQFKLRLGLHDTATLIEMEKRVRERARAWEEQERLRGAFWFQGVTKTPTLSGAHIRDSVAAHLLTPRVSRMILGHAYNGSKHGAELETHAASPRTVPVPLSVTADAAIVCGSATCKDSSSSGNSSFGSSVSNGSTTSSRRSSSSGSTPSSGGNTCRSSSVGSCIGTENCSNSSRGPTSTSNSNSNTSNEQGVCESSSRMFAPPTCAPLPPPSAHIFPSQRLASLSLKHLIRRGVPPHLRPLVWPAVSGAQKLKESAGPDYYSRLLLNHEALQTEATEQIQSDLHRTFPGHPRLDTPEGLGKLRRVLVAYSLRNTRVGYCQGMNFMTGYLLLVMGCQEEPAFWMLCALLENVLLEGCFAEDLFGCHVEQRVLQELLRAKKPKLCQHLESINFELSLVTTEWFLCLFSKSLPSETTLRIWDVLFHEGAKVLFRVGLAIFQINEQALMQSRHLGAAVGVVLKWLSEQYDPDPLLQVAFDKIGSLPMSVIEEKRKKQTREVTAVLETRRRQLTGTAEGHVQKQMKVHPPEMPNTCMPFAMSPSRTFSTLRGTGASALHPFRMREATLLRSLRTNNTMSACRGNTGCPEREKGTQESHSWEIERTTTA